MADANPIIYALRELDQCSFQHRRSSLHRIYRWVTRDQHRRDECSMRRYLEEHQLVSGVVDQEAYEVVRQIQMRLHLVGLHRHAQRLHRQYCLERDLDDAAYMARVRSPMRDENFLFGVK